MWFFSSTTNATRTFNPHYTVVGGLRIYSGGDQFYWKFIESDRAYSILASTVTLHLPGNPTPSQLMATTYLNGAANPGAAKIVDGNTVVFTGSNFNSGDEWEVRAQFPHGIV